MINAIKSWMLRSKMPKHPSIHFTGINSMKDFAILYDGTIEEDRQTILKWTKTLVARSKGTCASLGFYNHKLPLQNTDISLYLPTNLTWYNMPQGPEIDRFIKQSFDVLFVVSPTLAPHMSWIIANSKAKLKVGHTTTESNQNFDIVISIEKFVSIDQTMKAIIEAINKIAIH
jgi:hypothetical protein